MNISASNKQSCRGIALDHVNIAPTGLEHDRKFMLVKETDGKFSVMTMRKFPHMTLIRTRLDEDANCLVVSHASHPNNCLSIPLTPDPVRLQLALLPDQVDIWGAKVRPYAMGREYDLFFSNYLGVDCKLCYVGPQPRLVGGYSSMPNKRAVKHKPITSFSDGAPLLVCTEISYDDINSRLEQKLTFERFRPNIILKGVGRPYDEDDWKIIDVEHSGKIYLVDRCTRCQLPNVDPETGIAHPSEPYKTLAKYRRIDEGAPYSPIFGINGLFEFTKGSISVGSRVNVLERGNHKRLHP